MPPDQPPGTKGGNNATGYLPTRTRLYHRVTAFVKEEYRKGERATVNPLTLLTLQREICSSSFAAATTLFNLSQKADEAEAEKILALMELSGRVKRIPR